MFSSGHFIAVREARESHCNALIFVDVDEDAGQLDVAMHKANLVDGTEPADELLNRALQL